VPTTRHQPESRTPQHDALQVPARSIPIPSSISHEAQAILAMGSLVVPPYPDPGDFEGWRRYARQADTVLMELLDDQADDGVRTDTLDAEGVATFTATPHGISQEDRRVYMEIHGGGLVMGGGACCRAMASYNAARVGMRVISPDYRLPPDHPFPAGLDDCLAVYRWLLLSHQPGEIVVGGSSAGGNLGAAMVLRARDTGVPLPAAVVLISPQIDLTESGDSFHANLGLDTVLTSSLMNANLVYAGQAALQHPYVSPLFGDFTKGFPPTLLSAGTRDLFLSNTVRMHRALRSAGVQADLHILEAAPHAGFMADTPEDEDLEDERRRFIAAHCPSRHGTTTPGPLRTM
jgi:epsilon-lactone hydrolase